jgi:phage terminase large subunit
MNTIQYSPNPYQRDLHTTNSRFSIVAGGRRVGKSLSCIHETIKHCLETPNAVAWWVSPTLGDAREVGFEEFKVHMPVLEPAIRYINETRMKVVFTNNATLYFKGAENEKSLRGRGLTFLVIDEAAFIAPDVWRKALRPALSDKQGRAILCSTTNGKNWFWEQWSKAQKLSNWSTFHWPTYLNPLITESDLKDAQRELSNIDYRQEYLAEFITKAGLVYDDFTDENILNEFTFDPSIHDLYVGMDFGFAGYTAVCFMAVSRINGSVTQFDEILVSRLDIDRIVTMIKGKPYSMYIKEIYCDPAGNAEELTSGISPVDTLRRAKFKVVNKASSIAPGLALVRSYIRNAEGDIKFFITKNCEDTIKSLQAYSYKMSKSSELIKEEPDKDGFSDHMCDAIRYFFVNKFDKAKYVTDEVPTQSYLEPINAVSKTVLKRCFTCKSMFTSKTSKNKPPFECSKCKEK